MAAQRSVWQVWHGPIWKRPVWLDLIVGLDADAVRVGTLSASLLAWLWLAGDVASGVQSFCLSGEGLERLAASFRSASASGLLLSEAWHWMLMVTAMMAPLLAPPIRHVIGRSYRRRRWRAVAGFLLGYGALWAGAGISGATLLATVAIAGDATTQIAAAAALLAAAAWQLSPMRSSAMRRCHRTMALTPRGWAADRDCLHYGARQASACLAGCLPVMLATMLAFPGVLAPALVAFWLYIERGYQRNDRLIPAALLAGLGLAVAAATFF